MKVDCRAVHFSFGMLFAERKGREHLKKDILETVEALAAPLCEQVGVALYDVEYVKEGGAYYLRIFIDKPEGVDINECEAVSRLLDPALDKADPIPTAYYLEVSSVGLDRPLKKEKDFLHFNGQDIEVKTYQPIDGRKEFVGTLTSYEDGTFTITEKDGGTRTFAVKDTALVRPAVEF